MENSEDTYPTRIQLRLASVAYHAVVLAAFVIGLYGLISLFSLASAELQQKRPRTVTASSMEM
jgi:hypothetical protein